MNSKHSIERTIERAGLNRKAAIRMIENARTKGRESSEFSSYERKYLQKRETDGSRTLIYAGYCFLFDKQDVCITMYGVPIWFGKKQYHGKREIKNPRKYYRKYTEYIEDYAV